MGTTQNGTSAPPNGGAGAPTLSYSVAQQVCHTGQNIIELRLTKSDFIASVAAGQDPKVGT
jgi:hypothetical protein